MQTESYDPSGDTIATGGNTFAYNSWLKLVSMNGGQVTLAYDGLGQLVSKGTSTGTTQYLVDDLSPTGYPQVVEELQGGVVTRTYTYGLERISQLQPVTTNGNTTWTPSFYAYDGRGTVRMLTNSAGAVTDTYAYDAFGNLLAQTGSTPNVYLYRGERWDADLGLYYLRARWYNPATGRFMSRDPYSGSIWDPASLHRYNYARANPENYIDPSGRSNLTDYALNLSNRLAAAVVLTAVGIQVKCYYGAIGAMIAIIAESPFMTREQAQILSAQIDPSVGACWAKVTYQQFAEDTLLNLGFGYAGEYIGLVLQDGLQGPAWRLLTEEDGSFGPRATNSAVRDIVVGSTDGGPGAWGYSPKFPSGIAGEYQQYVTGAPKGVEYGVATDLQSSGWKWFDGYDSDTGNLVDAKYYQNWPNPDFGLSSDIVAKDLAQSANIASSVGKTLEVVVPTQQAADTLNQIVGQTGIPNITVTVKGW